MGNKLFKFEIVLTAIIVIIACCGIGVTIHKRVNKDSGELTTENYTEYMQVKCRIGGGFGGGNTMKYIYYITVSAASYYKLENVTVAYSLESDGADLPDGTLNFTVEAGGYFSKEYADIFTVTHVDDVLSGAVKVPTLKIVVKSVTGTYRYSI